MTPLFRRLAWFCAALTYALIVLGAWVRITDSGMGCGDHWPLCNGHLFPPLDDYATLIEWSHRLVVTLVAMPIAALAGYAWYLRRRSTPGAERPGMAAYLALGLVGLAAMLGRATVILELPPWTVILHFGTAMALLATLIAAARGRVGGAPSPFVIGLTLLAAITLLLGALTANLGAAGACTGFPLCNGQIIPDGGSLQHIHWIHRLFAYALAAWSVIWAVRVRWREGSLIVVALMALQVMVAAVMVLVGFPRSLQAAHVAVGAALWAVIALVFLRNVRSDSVESLFRREESAGASIGG
jgi:heme A synthase